MVVAGDILASYILHDHIVGGDAIARNEEKGLLVDLVQVANLAPGNKGEGALQVKCRYSFRHGESSQLGGPREKKKQCVISRDVIFGGASPIAASQPQAVIGDLSTFISKTRPGHTVV